MNYENIFYVYLHRRATDNKVFYVGKGKKKRAWNIYGRNDRWCKTYLKHGLIVEIVFDNLTEYEAFEVEKDTILEMRYFGYPLCNMTDGGEGSNGYKYTQADREKASLRSKSIKQKPENIKKRADAVREYYRNNKCIKHFSGLPWLHPNAPTAVWSNLDLIYQYYSICQLTQATLDCIFEQK